MTEMTLTVQTREGTRKGVTRKLRRAGIIPGVVYGVDAPISIQCDAKEAALLVHSLHGSERLISLKLEGNGGDKAREKSVLLKEVQFTPVGNHLLHIDLFEVDVQQEVQVALEIQPEGKPIGEKMGGILQQVTREITIQCLPTIIPEFLVANVESLEIGHSLHLSDIVIPEGIKIITSGEETIFVMAAPRVEEEEVEEELLEGEEGAVEGEEGETPEGEESPQTEESTE